MRRIDTIIRNRRPLKQLHRLIVLSIGLVLLGINAFPIGVVGRSTGAQTAVAIQTATALPLTGTFQVVSNLPGDQVDAHIDCDLASYTNDDFYQGLKEIRYFDFATNTDQGIPGNGTGSQSDVSGRQVSFLEWSASGPHIIIFDTVSQTRTVVPGFWHWKPALGGDLLAFEQRTTDPDLGFTEAEIGTYALNTGMVSWLTDDTLFDMNPAVSPTGNAVVWVKCQTNESGCDIYAAIQTAPGVFTTHALTSTLGEERQPRTNGQIAVYTSTRDGETDIYYQPVAGGAETRLSIPGEQRGPNISGNLISFESQTQIGDFDYDVFVFDIITGHLYQVTNTPGVAEVLSDISVCNGIGRIVYAAPAADYDVYAFTFQPPSSTLSQIDDLIELVESFNLPHGIENSLITKLQNALAAIAVSDTATACSSLTAFINECQAQSDKKLTTAQATQLINSANQVKTDLGCP